MLILGIDPGTERCGWAVLSENKSSISSINYGCIFTSKNDTDAKRLQQLHDEILKLIKKFKPDALAIENLFFNTNAKTAIVVGQARGVIMLAAQIKNIPIFSYSPLEIKMAITGYGRAEKVQIQKMVVAILHLRQIPEPDDAADALAVALTHAFMYKLKQITTDN